MSATHGNERAQFYLGLMYTFGNGVEKNYANAAKCYRYSAQNGFKDAQLALGDAYAKGKGVNKEWSEAANWYIKAACQGEAKAQFALGLIYEKGKGVKKILDEALKWYSEAAKQGNAEAIRKVAKLKKIGFLSMMMAESDARQHIGYVLKVTIFHIYGNWDILLPYRLYPKGCQPMAISTVFINNRTQAVRLPAEVRLPEGVKHVSVRAIGNERIIAPVENTWDSFFINGPQASEDFLTERASQQQDEREALE